MLKIALDAMGADHGVAPIVDGLINSLKQRDFKAFLVGDSSLVKGFMDSKQIPSAILNRIEIVHADDAIQMTELASTANKRTTTSIYQAIQILKGNDADACLSAGHSGATMSLATLQIGRIEGVLRPAICTCMPTVMHKPSVILDAGANTDCKPEYLVGFAIMGYHYAKRILGFENPKVGLLSNGEEDSKGNDLTKQTFKLLREYDFFKGNVEGSDIFNGSVEVVVCDGFTGNLVLKASEGVASSISAILKDEVKKSLVNILGYSLMKGAFSRLKSKIDYAEYGGALLLGVKKPVLISHGKSQARAIENALYQAITSCETGVCDLIEEAFRHHGHGRG